jgi:hypothetical protein
MAVMFEHMASLGRATTECDSAALLRFVDAHPQADGSRIAAVGYLVVLPNLYYRRTRDYWLQEHGGGWLVQTFLALVALAFPDLQLFNLVDDIVAGATIPLALFVKTATLGFFYTSFYLLLAWTVFYRREL